MERMDGRIAAIVGQVSEIVPTLKATGSLLDGLRGIDPQEQGSERLSKALLTLTRELLFLEGVLRNLARQAEDLGEYDSQGIVLQ